MAATTTTQHNSQRTSPTGLTTSIQIQFHNRGSGKESIYKVSSGWTGRPQIHKETNSGCVTKFITYVQTYVQHVPLKSGFFVTNINYFDFLKEHIIQGLEFARVEEEMCWPFTVTGRGQDVWFKFLFPSHTSTPSETT